MCVVFLSIVGYLVCCVSEICTDDSCGSHGRGYVQDDLSVEKVTAAVAATVMKALFLCESRYTVTVAATIIASGIKK